MVKSLAALFIPALLCFMISFKKDDSASHFQKPGLHTIIVDAGHAGLHRGFGRGRSAASATACSTWRKPARKMCLNVWKPRKRTTACCPSSTARKARCTTRCGRPIKRRPAISVSVTSLCGTRSSTITRSFARTPARDVAAE